MIAISSTFQNIQRYISSLLNNKMIKFNIINYTNHDNEQIQSGDVVSLCGQIDKKNDIKIVYIQIKEG